ncbi:methyltransferase domain-containing protein [Candidatus Pacearchaeota archaeon]|nr:methyltransferase domain-containing protein [Candidatus Pacearchaeota archaeon]
MKQNSKNKLTESYGGEFFREKKGATIKSAKVIAPIVLDILKSKSIVDVGCGEGEFLKVFSELGVRDFIGIDGPWVDKTRLEIPEKNFRMHNLEESLNLNRKFDLVISLEVAEHLRPEKSKMFVKQLTKLGDNILFSAAIPFQGGTSHLNEQWQDYWANLFKKEGYVPMDYIRSKIWNNPEVAFWYSQNMLLYVKNNNKFQQAEFINVVHPKLYTAKMEFYNKMKRLFLPVKWFLSIFRAK